MGTRANLVKREERWTRDNYNARTLDKYQPFLTVRDVPSKGKRFRIPGLKTGRLHHLLSIIEACFFYIFDTSLTVLDIREQYLIPLAETLVIAKQLGIRHPHMYGRPHPITTDFVITKTDGSIHPFSVKCASKITGRDLKKFNIEKIAWQRRQRTLTMLTDKAIARPMLTALEWVHKFADIDKAMPELKDKERIVPLVKQFVTINQHRNLNDVCIDLDYRHSLGNGVALNIVRHLIVTKKLRVDLREGIDTLKQLKLIQS